MLNTEKAVLVPPTRHPPVQIPDDAGQLEEFDDHQLNLMRALKSPLWFLEHCVYTKDPADPAHPIKPAPAQKEYIRRLVEFWENPKAPRRYIMEKSRRMWQTWLYVALHTHMALTSRYAQIYFISKKEEDADELVDRVTFIMDHIPTDLIPKSLRPKYNKTYCLCTFPETESFIKGVPQGSNQLRQHGATAIFWDEAAFHEKAEETYASMLPTLLAPKAAGRLSIISSVLPGTLFQKILHDKLQS